jgi:hypothetical protein
VSVRNRGLIVIALCGAVAACASGDARSISPTTMTNEGACVSYGFAPGTTPYTVCVQRESEGRGRGRNTPTSDKILIAREARAR